MNERPALIYPLDTTGETVSFAHDDTTYTDTFAKLYDWTWSIDISLAARGVYAYILYRIGAKSKAWPRRKQIAQALGISERSLHGYLHELEHHGLIRIVDHQREGRPSEYIATRKDYASARQTLLQNLQEVAVGGPPPAKSARPSCKICKTLLQNLQDNKDIDTRADTRTDTRRGTDVPAPPFSGEQKGSMPLFDQMQPDAAPSVSLAEESGTSTMTTPAANPSEKEPSAPRPAGEACTSVSGGAAPAPAPARKKVLRSAEPEVYAAREALKAHWLSKTRQQWEDIAPNRRKWMDADLEHLARRFPLDEVTAAMDRAWDAQWSNGEYPARRATWRLSSLPDKIAEYRRNDAQGPPAQRGRSKMPASFENPEGPTRQPTAAQHTASGQRIYCKKCKRVAGRAHDTALCGKTGTVTEADVL